MPGDSIPHSKRKRGLRFYALVVGTVVVLLLAGSYALWYSAASAALRAEIEQARARGEPVWFEEVEAAPVDRAEDGGPLYLAAMTKVAEPDEKFNALYQTATAGGAGTGTGAAVGRAGATGPSDHPEFRQAIAENAAALALVREAASKPRCRIQRDYRTPLPFTIVLEDVQKARNLARVLEADMLQSLAAGEGGRAVGAIEDLFHLAECLREDPFLVSQLARMDIGGMALDSIETVLEHGELTDEQFARLDTRLKAVEAAFRLKRAMLAERASLMTSIEHLNEHDAIAGEMGAETKGLFALRPNILDEQAFVLDVMGQIGVNADEPGRAGAQASQQLQAAIDAAPARYTLVRMLLPSVSTARSAGLRFRQRLTNARLALRVDRYRAEHGKLPEKLDDVLDESLARLPAGNFSGKPLVYHRQGDGFAIYAPGSNGTDDGGAMQPDQEEGGTAMTVQYAGRGGSEH